MAEVGLGSILNMDAGISRVVWDSPGLEGTLPDRRQLAPSELPTTQQLDRLLQVDNLGAVLARALRPVVGSPDTLRPDKFEDALQSAAAALQQVIGSASGVDRESLEDLASVLHEHGELKAALDYYRDMLIAG